MKEELHTKAANKMIKEAQRQTCLQILRPWLILPRDIDTSMNRTELAKTKPIIWSHPRSTKAKEFKSHNSHQHLRTLAIMVTLQAYDTCRMQGTWYQRTPIQRIKRMQRECRDLSDLGFNRPVTFKCRASLNRLISSISSRSRSITRRSTIPTTRTMPRRPRARCLLSPSMSQTTVAARRIIMKAFWWKLATTINSILDKNHQISKVGTFNQKAFNWNKSRDKTTMNMLSMIQIQLRCPIMHQTPELTI